MFPGGQGLPGRSAAVLCAQANVGEVAITGLAFLIAALIERTSWWPLLSKPRRGQAAFLVIGIVITIAVEISARQHQQWTYDVTMPTIFGIGLLPLGQWVILPVLELMVFRLLWMRVGARAR